jgi:uncharacterized membrane protein YoaK (UPF0700 family)
MVEVKKKVTPLQDRPTKEYLAITLGGMLLSCNGGMLNATTVSDERGLSTGPMTGATTTIGISLAQGAFPTFGVSCGVLISHILGAMISGYLVPNRTFYLSSPYGRIFKFGALVLALAAITDLVAPDALYYYFLVAFSTGIQNAITSRYWDSTLSSGTIVQQSQPP